jgi:hypothetical protein
MGERHFSKDMQQDDDPKEKKRGRRKGILCEQLVFKWTIYTDLELIQCVCYVSQISVCIFWARMYCIYYVIATGRKKAPGHKDDNL